MSLSDSALRTRTEDVRPCGGKVHVTSGISPKTHSSGVDSQDVTLIARDLRNNAVFLPILSAVNEILRSAYCEAQAKEDESPAVELDEDSMLMKLENEEDTNQQADEEEEEEEPRYSLNGYILGPKEFKILSERLPQHYLNHLVKYELYDGRLTLRVCPASPHGRLAGYVNEAFIRWSQDINDFTSLNATLISCTDENYYYTNQRSKSPDVSFVPRSLQIPPALPQPNSINARHPQGKPFPTVVFECGYNNETWPRLLRDACTKTFAVTTSVQVWIGTKIYRASREFRCVWGKRRDIGHKMKLVKTTHKMSLDQPTTVTLTIPATLVYWGTTPIPAHLQGTSCILHCEVMRQRVSEWVE